MSTSRRHVLLLGLALCSPHAARAADAWHAAARDLLAPVRAGVEALGGPGLLKSYTTEGGEEFDRTHAETAYTYDNAMAGLALLAGGEPALAGRIAEGLRLAQAQDRHWTDGRLRNAYPAGRQRADAPGSGRPPGWWDAAQGRWLEDGYAAGTGTGPVAFAILLWTALGGASFRTAAERAADWVERECAAARGFTGGTIGHEPNPAKQRWLSTEQNLDLAVAFARLGRRASSEKGGRVRAGDVVAVRAPLRRRAGPAGRGEPALGGGRQPVARPGLPR
jgi:hypothetical protein